MAKKKRFGRIVRVVRRRTALAARRVGASVKRRVGEQKSELLTPAVSAATAGALGYAESEKYAIPTVAGIMPAALYGAVAAVLGTVVRQTAKGTPGKAIRGLATGFVSVAAYKLGKGEKFIAEEKPSADKNAPPAVAVD
jgi:hypothetical protein